VAKEEEEEIAQEADKMPETNTLVEDIEEERAVAAIFTDAAAIISAVAMAAAVIKISQEEDGPEHKNDVLFGRFLLLFLSVYIPLVCNLSTCSF
jgi:hypothetical protein